MLFTVLNVAHAELPATLVEEVDFSELAYEMVRIPAGEYVMGEKRDSVLSDLHIQ